MASFVYMHAAGKLHPPTEQDDIHRMEALSVEEKGLGRSYLLIDLPDFHILSPFNEKDTQAYAQEFQRQRMLISLVIPERLHARYDMPQAVFIDDQAPAHEDLTSRFGVLDSKSAGILRQSIDAVRGVPPEPANRSPNQRQAAISWCRSTSDDGVVFYSSIFRTFDYVRQSQSGRIGTSNSWLSWVFPTPVLFLHRRPPWPEWLTYGLSGLRVRCLGEKAVQFFAPTVTLSPPTNLNIEALFAETPTHELSRQAAVVFVSWGLFEGREQREKFWRFAELAARQRVTLQAFHEFFGADASSAILRFWTGCIGARTASRVLATYLLEEQPAVAPAKIRRATRTELVRIKSEYEWNIGRLLSDVSPEVSRQCIDQAGRRFRFAYGQGERDPAFLAAFALYCCDTNAPDARYRVEEAVAAKAQRPRLYYELARLRYIDESARSSDQESTFAEQQVDYVLQPLQMARSLRPELAEVYHLMANVWLRCAAPPPLEQLQSILRGVRLFPRDTLLTLNTAMLFARTREPETDSIIEHGLQVAQPGTELAERLMKLKTTISSGKTPVD